MADPDELIETINNFKDKTVLIIGDYCIDEYLYGDASSLAPEAPILRVVLDENVTTVGAAGNVAHNFKALGAKVYATGIVGIDFNSTEIIRLLHNLRIDTLGMIFQKGRVTPKYSRITVGDKHFPKQKIVRFDIENKIGVEDSSVIRLFDFIKSKIDLIDIIIVADYDEVNQGLINQKVLQEIVDIAKKNDILIIGDSRKNLANFRGFSCLVPNIKEAELAYGKKITSIKETASELINKLELGSILVTKDKEGMEIMTNKGLHASIPSVAKKVVEVGGAGDTVTCTFSLALSSGLSYEDSVKLASYAAGIGVSREGTCLVSSDELKEYVKKSHENTSIHFR